MPRCPKHIELRFDALAVKRVGHEQVHYRKYKLGQSGNQELMEGMPLNLSSIPLPEFVISKFPDRFIESIEEPTRVLRATDIRS
jgi:hypothetical protein